MRPINNSSSDAESRTEEMSGSDPYLVAAVNDCHAEVEHTVSENMAVVYDELGTTATRRRAALLQVQGKNLTGKTQ
jgi:hypothetical protein